MKVNEVMQELEVLGKERTKKIYLSKGAHEPLFGVATGAMKPMAKQIRKNQPLAEQLLEVNQHKPKSKPIHAFDNIQKALDRNQLGFKRKYVRC